MLDISTWMSSVLIVGAICRQLIAFGIEIEGNPREFVVDGFGIRQNNLELALDALFSLSLVNVEVKTLWLQCQETIQPVSRSSSEHKRS